MARSRNIKPDFFTNEQIGENCPLGRLLFIGLWTVADYTGNLEWKERALKVKLLPWDDCDVKKLAINLDNSGLIRFYSDGNKIYVNIPNFIKHQNPHKNEREKGSELPAYSEKMRQAVDLKEITINRDLSGLKPESSHSNRADYLLLIPDSIKPITDSGLAESQQVAQTPQAAPPATPEKKSRKVGSRLPDDWRPTQDYVDAAMQLNPDYTREWFSTTAHKFKNYWIAKTGKDATKANWLATWRNWVLNDLEFNRGKRNAGQPQQLDDNNTDWINRVFPNSGIGEQDFPVTQGDFPGLEVGGTVAGALQPNAGGMAQGADGEWDQY